MSLNQVSNNDDECEMSRSEKFKSYKEKMTRLSTYLSTACYPPGLTKTEKKTIRAQVKCHAWDDESKL